MSMIQDTDITTIREIIDNFEFKGEQMSGVYKDCLIRVIKAIELKEM